MTLIHAKITSQPDLPVVTKYMLPAKHSCHFREFCADRKETNHKSYREIFMTRWVILLRRLISASNIIEMGSIYNAY